jgi:hypothetical protein
MGPVYGYEMWVPRERLYEFLQLTNKHLDKSKSTLFCWPDGGELEFFGARDSYLGDKTERIAFDYSMDLMEDDSYFLLNLICETDEYLSANYPEWKQPDDKHLIRGIWLRIDLCTDYWGWLDDEEDYVFVSFLSPLGIEVDDCQNAFVFSLSIRQLFVNLAQTAGAISCVLDTDLGDDRTFYLDGKVMDAGGLSFNSFRTLRTFINPNRELSKKEQRLQSFQYNRGFSHHDLIERIQWAQFDEDAGIRAAACNWLSTIRTEDFEDLICTIAREDENWRVRYAATRLLTHKSKDALFLAIHDENFQVRIAAIKTVAERISSKTQFVEELVNMISQLPCYGPSMETFYKAMKYLAEYGETHHAQIIRQRMSEADFPFQWEAQKAIERLSDWKIVIRL